MKLSGILMPVSALPSPYLVGDFGPQAYRFADMAKKAGFDMWQMLPLNTLGYGNSPYQCLSSKALDPIYVSIDLLRKEGLVKKHYPKKITKSVDFEAAKIFKREVLEEAFSNFTPDDDYRSFAKTDWVRKYALFVAFKQKNDQRCWNQWPEEYKNYALKPDEKVYEENRREIEFQIFSQYILFKQFNQLKKYVNDIGLKVIGDIPFYVGIDSDDVYYNRDCFELDSDGHPVWIAGVPPDYFNDQGQRWGNPLYRWDVLKKRGFDLWFERLRFNANIFDILRIDHFRAFDTYWKISGDEPTAINGVWIENCGEEFFESLFKKYPDIDIVAEDLGDLRPEVHELRDKFNLTGMKVIQFGFFEPSKNNELCYIGTHDNDSMTSWFKTQTRRFQREVRAAMKKKYPDKKLFDAILQYALDMKSKFVILQVSDIILDDRRINFPGTIGSPNWEYKLASFRSLAHRLKVISGVRK
ncbi:MAG: 4-alpha-glucanotransferase [Erysipelotrichaceae bacterium]|nr:4-alpha-glucanotransferase [Erysipelotrichaceae bacterium]